MSTQIRDSEFGQIWRRFSGGPAFQYPDEVDTSLRPRSLATDGAITSSISSKEQEVHQDPDSTDHNANANGESMHPRLEKEDKKTAFIVDWYGHDDPENPQNWPSGWKVFVTFQICLLNFAIYIASSIYVPGEPSIQEDFDVSEVVATLGLSLYTVGYGFGPMLWSPMSEIPSIGRRGIYFWTMLLYVLLQLPTGFAVNMPMFLVFRVITGFFGSPALATGGGTITDMYNPSQSAYGICILGFFGVCGPVFGPIIGGFLAPVKGWRWTIWVVAWLGSFVVVMLFFLLPETSAANILYRRAKRVRKATGDIRFRSQSEIDNENYTLKDHLVVLGKAFTLTFSEPIVFFLDLYTALLYGILFIWFESFPLVFGGIYNFTSGEQGLVFLGIFISGVITVAFYFVWVKYGLIARFNSPNFQPESMLLPTFFGSATLPICLFWYGWSARPCIHWIVPVIGSSSFTIAIITLFFPVLNYLSMAYPHNVASIFAGNALFRAAFGAGFPLFARQLFRKLGVGPGNSLLGGIAVVFMVLPFVFYKYGSKLRQMSKNARHDV